ncbi:hypothetical protein O6H91_Y166200 [Diphasiastrum complanatum]|nr:hypothetical protein O6H91_Y166200 [Diphasiastrum complanatum]
MTLHLGQPSLKSNESTQWNNNENLKGLVSIYHGRKPKWRKCNWVVLAIDDINCFFGFAITAPKGAVVLKDHKCATAPRTNGAQAMALLYFHNCLKKHQTRDDEP